MIFRGHSVRGHLVLDPKAEAWLWRYDDEPMHVELTPVYARRSVPQNRRQWAGYTRALRSFAALSGHDKEELHDAMKNRFIEPVRLYTHNGELIGEARSTKRLPVPKFADFSDQVGALFAGWGVDLWPEA